MIWSEETSELIQFLKKHGAWPDALISELVVERIIRTH